MDEIDHIAELLAERRGTPPLPQSARDAIRKLISEADPLSPADAMKIGRTLSTSPLWKTLPPGAVTPTPVDR